MKRPAAALAAALATLLAQGCALSPQATRPNESDAMLAIHQISVEIRDEMRLLAKAGDAAASESLTPAQAAQRAFQAAYVPDGFDELADFNFVGPAVQAAAALALTAGYRFEGPLNPPDPPLIVNVNMRGRPLMDALRELSAQTAKAALIEVFVHDRLITFRSGERPPGAASITSATIFRGGGRSP